MLTRLLSTTAPWPTLLIRLMVGAVFVSEGIQKFLFADQLGAGRFVKIGLPMPELLGPMVGGIEIVAGVAVILGAGTRVAAVLLATIMCVALLSTKLPILLERGFWVAAHESRTDWSMLLGSLFLLIVGAGPWSVDARLSAPAEKGSTRR